MTNIKACYKWISSMRFGLILLCAIGLIAAVGSLLSPESFFDSMLFKLFLLLLLLNLTLCTLNRIVKYLKKAPAGERIKPRRIRQVAILILHAGIVLILIGGTVNSFYGVRGQIPLLEGETADLADLGEGIPYHLGLTKFEIEYNPDGSASQYYSDISILKENHVVAEEKISINNPLEYKGIKVYLLKYVYGINVESQSKSGLLKNEFLSAGESFGFPDTKTTIRIEKYVPNYDPAYGMETKTLRPDNPKILYTVNREEQEPKLMVVSLGQYVEVEQGVYFKFSDIKPYVGLIVKSDPGLTFAAMGGVMLMLGACLSFIREKRT